MNLVRFILHLEGLAVLVAATLAYFLVLSGWWVAFVALLLLPDLSMIGFLRGTRLGALTYNLVHNYVLGLATVGLGVALASDPLTGAGLILIAHVGMDRALGYGLKFPTHFKDTHLQRLSSPSAVTRLGGTVEADAPADVSAA
jgi:hypothetical protein